ncbi:MAG TPA: armadillo/beta-catenin-like repeat-containing protein [Gemmataceae bacterium]|nr:armadillo/beta-catenin-like repeat-containing protein [Gemmataceae bacterium]
MAKNRKLSIAEPKGFTPILWIFLFLIILIHFFLFRNAIDRSSYIVIAIATVLGLPILAIAVYRIKLAVLQHETFDLAIARKSAREEGTLFRLGAVTVWYSGTSKGMEILEDQLEETRSRFAEYVNESIEIISPLRLVSFAHKEQFGAYLLRLGHRLGRLEGAYLLGRPRRIIICVEKPAHRLIKIDRLLNVLYSYYFLEQYLGFFPQSWLNMGFGNFLADRPGEEVQARLRRKMLVSFAKGTTFDASQLFSLKGGRLIKAIQGQDKHENVQYVSQFMYQAASTVAYLSEKNRKQIFLEFLKDLKKKKPVEPVFIRHFGHGFEQLFENWQAWVKALGPGIHFPPPKDLREQLLNYIIPLILDADAPIQERIQAIRDMGNAGYLLGADALIELLHDPELRIRTVSLWALQNISGLALGDNVSQWSSWWDNLPADVQPVANSMQAAPTQEV